MRVKRLEGPRGAAALFLHYLATLSEVPAALESLDPVRHIHDPTGGSETFREWLAGRYPAEGNGAAARAALARRTTVLSKLASMFAAQIAAKNLRIPNPIDMKVVAFKGGARRGKTPRPAMEAEKLELIRRFNERDDFAFSKGIKTHYRKVFDPETGCIESRWFPAYAVLIDLLLELPFRSFQARYLDSGEGDEFIFDPVTRRMVANTGPLATPRRQEGALCTVDLGPDSKDRDGPRRHVVGLRVNTNKTAEHCSEQGWTIPWCPADLEEKLIRMREWAAKYAPVKEPIKAKAETYLDEFLDEEVAALIPDTHPLFRDPAREDGHPLSRESLFKYWIELLVAVEEEHNEGRKPENRIALTKLRADGTRAPIYDIHALRVSGITAMIERGMPPDMVQEVVGHASMVMTLYYNKVRASRIYAKLEAYFRERGMSAAALGEAPFEKVAASLFNMRLPEDAVGLEMLKERFGGGEGTWKVLAHGICPGGDCATGGKWYKNAHLPLRPGACSLCRYRVTGPGFLLGMTANANTMMFEMRRLGEEIAGLTRQRFALQDRDEPTAAIDGRLELARRAFDSAAAEWSAEVQYVQAALKLIDRMDGDAPERAHGEGRSAALITPLDGKAFSARIEARHEFHLFQSVAESAEVATNFRTGTREAILDRDEWLNAVLDANGYEPLMLKLPKEVRLRAGNLLGRAFMELVPEDKLDGLRLGVESIDIAPALRELCDEAAEQVRATRTLDLRNLPTAARRTEVHGTALLTSP